jgi:ABC-type cobalamin/Fe3+-siderophores transport system ATPase subunit
MNLLQADNVTFAYGQRDVLRNVSVMLRPGEVVALLGPNGSGKSTLIKSLLGHLRANGSIVWLDRSLNKWKRRELARSVAYLAQSPLFDPGQSVVDALRVGRAPYWGAFGIESPRDMEKVQEVSRLLGLDQFLDRPLEELSGGQRQRVFLGRCLVQEPSAMLLDEPNTFLDLKHQVELCKLLKQLSRDQSLGVLMASHDLNLASAFADRIVLLEDGAIAASGAPEEVLQPELLSRVYGLELQKVSNQPVAVLPRV